MHVRVHDRAVRIGVAVLQQNGDLPLALLQIDIEVPREVVVRADVAGVCVVDDARAALHGEEVRGDLARVAAVREERDGPKASVVPMASSVVPIAA